MAPKSNESWNSWYRHEIDGWQGSAEVAALSDAGYRAFHNLIQYQFQRSDGMILNDDRTLRVQSRLSAEKWAQCREEVLELFDEMGNGKIANIRQYKEWQRANEFFEQHLEKSKAGAKKRWKNKQTDATGMPQACHGHSAGMDQAMPEDATLRNGTLRKEEQQAEVAGEERLGAVLVRIACAHPKSREKCWSEIDVTPAAMAAVSAAVTREASATGTSLIEAAHVVHALTLEIQRQTPASQVRFVPNIEKFFYDSEYRSPAGKWSGNGRSNSTGRTKSERNLDALREVLGPAPAMDQPAAHRDSEREAGDDLADGPASVLEGHGGLPPRGYRDSGAGVVLDATP